ncbi:hypothetical protein [Petrachloros mirabilis]
MKTTSALTDHEVKSRVLTRIRHAALMAERRGDDLGQDGHDPEDIPKEHTALA